MADNSRIKKTKSDKASTSRAKKYLRFLKKEKFDMMIKPRTNKEFNDVIEYKNESILRFNGRINYLTFSDGSKVEIDIKFSVYCNAVRS